MRLGERQAGAPVPGVDPLVGAGPVGSGVGALAAGDRAVGDRVAGGSAGGRGAGPSSSVADRGVAGPSAARHGAADPSADGLDARLAAIAADAAAVVFDLDGVLVDTEPWWHEVRADYAAERGLAWTADDSRACMGRNSREWSAIMRDRLALAEPPEAIERDIVDRLVARYMSRPVPVVDGAPEAAARIGARLPVAIASSAHAEVIAAALAATALAPLFRVVVSSDDVPTGKPAPDVYLEAARRLGVAAADCLVVEDSRNGVLAGRAAGMRVVLVPNASVPPGPGAVEAADAVVARLADLPIGLLGAGR